MARKESYRYIVVVVYSDGSKSRRTEYTSKTAAMNDATAEARRMGAHRFYNLYSGSDGRTIAGWNLDGLNQVLVVQVVEWFNPASEESTMGNYQNPDRPFQVYFWNGALGKYTPDATFDSIGEAEGYAKQKFGNFQNFVTHALIHKNGNQVARIDRNPSSLYRENRAGEPGWLPGSNAIKHMMHQDLIRLEMAIEDHPENYPNKAQTTGVYEAINEELKLRGYRNPGPMDGLYKGEQNPEQESIFEYRDRLVNMSSDEARRDMDAELRRGNIGKMEYRWLKNKIGDNYNNPIELRSGPVRGKMMTVGLGILALIGLTVISRKF